MQLRSIGSPKPELVISVFPSRSLEARITDYLELARRHGCRSIFTNLIGMGEEDVPSFRRICARAKELGFAINADIDASVCEKLGFSFADITPLRLLGITGVRLDVPFDARQIADIAAANTDFGFEINASDFSGLEREITALRPSLGNVSASHNFFPQVRTGLSVAKFEVSSANMRAAGLKVAAFVTNHLPDTIRAWKDNSGTPSLELFRGMRLEDQMQWAAASAFTDRVIVSDMFVTDEQFAFYAALDVGLLRFVFTPLPDISEYERRIVAYDGHFLRGDNPEEWMFRSTSSRKVFKEPIPPKAESGAPFEMKGSVKHYPPGTVVVLNESAGRYSGELHILARSTPVEAHMNAVGSIDKAQLPLLSLGRAGLRFRLREG